MQDGEQLAFSEASNRSNRETNSSAITLLLFFSKSSRSKYGSMHNTEMCVGLPHKRPTDECRASYSERSTT